MLPPGTGMRIGNDMLAMLARLAARRHADGCRSLRRRSLRRRRTVLINGRRPRSDVVGYQDGHRLARAVSNGVRARDRNGVDAASTIAEAIGPQLNGERTGDHPVTGRERFSAGHGIDSTGHRTAARIAHIRDRDGDWYHLAVRWPHDLRRHRNAAHPRRFEV